MKDGSKEKSLTKKTYLKSCKAEGLCPEACELKFKINGLKRKNDELTKSNVEAHEKVMFMLK